MMIPSRALDTYRKQATRHWGRKRKPAKVAMPLDQDLIGRLRFEWMSGGDEESLLAYDGDRAIGNITIDRGRISEIEVDPEYRRRGVATALYEEALKSWGELEHGLVTEQGKKWVDATEPGAWEFVPDDVATEYYQVLPKRSYSPQFEVPDNSIYRMPSEHHEQDILPMTPTPLGPCERCGDGMVRDAEGVYCPSCGHRTNPDIQNGRIDMYAPLGEGIAEGPYDTMSKVADIVPRPGVRFFWNDREYEITGRGGDHIHFTEIGGRDEAEYELPLREWQYEVGMGNIYRTAGVGDHFEIGDRVIGITDEGRKFGEVIEVPEHEGGYYRVRWNDGSENPMTWGFLYHDQGNTEERVKNWLNSPPEECPHCGSSTYGVPIFPDGHWQCPSCGYDSGIDYSIYDDVNEQPVTDDLADKLWPDTLPWGEEEQNYYRHASYWVMEGSNLPWWLPSKTAADVRQLANQALTKLWQRDDLRNLWAQMAQFEAICNKYGIADNPEGLYLLEHIFPWVDDPSKEPPLLRANMRSRGYGDDTITQAIEHAKELKPYYQGYQDARIFEEVLTDLEARYPESYKIWPWAVKQIKTALKVNNRAPTLHWNTNWQHFSDIVGQAGGLITKLRQQNQLPEGFDINRLDYSEVDQWLKDYNAENVGEGWEERNVWATLPNGWTVEEVKTPNDLQREGELMGHCVGGYCKQVEKGTSLIFSLRDPNGGPHVTFEFKPIYDQMTDEGGPWQHDIWNPQGAKITKLQLVQVQGKSDSVPKPEYREMVKEFNQYLQGEGYEIEWSNNAWRHQGDRDQQIMRLRNENTYDLQGIEGLHRLEQDYDQNGGTDFFTKQLPDMPDEYGVPGPSMVPENWLNHSQLRATTEEVLEEVMEGKIPNEEYEAFGRKLLVAWYSLLSQPYASYSSLGSGGPYSPKSPVDARSWLVQFIGEYERKLVAQWNENNNGPLDRGAPRPQTQGFIDMLTRITAFQMTIAQKTGTQLLDMTRPDIGPGGQAPIHYWQQQELERDQGSPIGDYVTDPPDNVFGSWKLSRTTLYHVTNSDNRDSIMANGLDPAYAPGKDYIWLWDDPAKAAEVAQMGWGVSRNNDVWGVDASGLHLMEDPHGSGQRHYYMYQNAFATADHIPPDRLWLHQEGVPVEDNSKRPQKWWSHVAVGGSRITPDGYEMGPREFVPYRFLIGKDQRIYGGPFSTHESLADHYGLFDDPGWTEVARGEYTPDGMQTLATWGDMADRAPEDIAQQVHNWGLDRAVDDADWMPKPNGEVTHAHFTPGQGFARQQFRVGSKWSRDLRFDTIQQWRVPFMVIPSGEHDFGAPGQEHWELEDRRWLKQQAPDMHEGDLQGHVIFHPEYGEIPIFPDWLKDEDKKQELLDRARYMYDAYAADPEWELPPRQSAWKYQPPGTIGNPTRSYQSWYSEYSQYTDDDLLKAQQELPAYPGGGVGIMARRNALAQVMRERGLAPTLPISEIPSLAWDRMRDRNPGESIWTSNWKYAVAGIPANYTEEDPLDLQGKQPVFQNMQVDWWKLPPDQQRQAIVNAFRATMLSPRLNLKNNAIMYQEFMNIPANESDPDVFEQHARDLKERWDRQGQGDLFDEVQPMGWEQVVPGKLIPGFWGNIRRLAALGPYADQLRQAALDDLNENGGRGTLFRNEVLKLGIPGVGPKVASFAWLALNPKGSDLATIDVWMMRHLNQDAESPNTPSHYFDLEDQLRDEKDQMYGPNTPLGQYQWGVWDKIRTPGYHQDHSPLRVYNPTPYTDVAWSPQYRAPRPQQLPEQNPDQQALFAKTAAFISPMRKGDEILPYEHHNVLTTENGLAAWVNGQQVGNVTYTVYPDDYIFLHWLYVEPEYQGRGIMREMIDALYKQYGLPLSGEFMNRELEPYIEKRNLEMVPGVTTEQPWNLRENSKVEFYA